MTRNKIKSRTGDRVFDILNTSFAIFVLLVMLYPIIIVVSSSFSNPYALMAGKVWLYPVGLTLDGYKAIFAYKQVWTGMYNSFVYTVGGTVVNMIVTVLAAYPLSRKDFTVRNYVALLFAFTMWFSGGLIPTYLLIKDLGLFNSRWVMIIPTALNVWNMIIVRTYFQSNISDELLESAQLDGCDDFKYLLKIAVPLSKPVLAVVALYYMAANWNVFMSAYLYLQKQSLHPIQVVLREILLIGSVERISTSASSDSNAQMMNELLKYSLVIVASLPMVLVYPFVQKYFVQGIMVGAVKG